MVLPLLFSFLGGGLAKAGVLGAAGSFLANPLVASAIGSGIGTLAETGDPKKALLGGLGSFAGGSLMNNLMGGASSGALQAPLAGQSTVGSGAGAMTTGTPLYAQPGMTGSALLPPPPQAGGILGGRMGDVASAGMEFAKSGAGIGSTIGGMLPGMLMPPKPNTPQQSVPDLMQQRAMPRQVQTPGPDYRPGLSGEFDYGLSAPYTTEYMQEYAPRGMAMGGMVDNPYAERYAQERGEMFAPLAPVASQMGAPMRMAEGGGVERDYGFQVQRGAPISANSGKGGTVERVPFGQTGQSGSTAALLHYSDPRGVNPDNKLARSLLSAIQNRAPGLAALKGGLRQAEPVQQIIEQAAPEMRPRATPTATRTTSSALAEQLERNPMRMAVGGQVQRMVPGYGPVAMQAGGIAEIGAEPVQGAAQPNEREVISAAVAAIQGQHPQPEMALGVFLQQYGEEALRDLVDRVQSGEMGDTQERFANGENGAVRGPGDGSGTDDMVPAVVDGQSDVLLSDGEFVLRKDSTDALNNAFGPEFMDRMNQAGPRAPEVVKQMAAA
jgi:hypothetical protein